MKQFGNLTSFKQIQGYFQKCRAQSRQILLKRIYPQQAASSTKINNLTKSSKNKQCNIQSQRLSSQISTTFQSLLNLNDFNLQNPIVKQISRLFNINVNYFYGKSKDEKSKYVLEKINEEIIKNFNQEVQRGDTRTLTSDIVEINQQKDNPEEKTNAFQWLGVHTKYTHLKSIFQQILMERIKLFDNQLTELALVTKKNFNSTQELLTTARTYDFPQHSKKLNTTHASLQNLSRKKSLTKVLSDEKSGFCNIKIRDSSTFSLEKWTQKQQKQYQKKRIQYKSREHTCHSGPILFQFVKKYTCTIKARQNIYKKYQCRDTSSITPQQLKYLCATSLFLNQTLTHSQKQRYKRNVSLAGSSLISKLEFNIAQHIIDTYKVFMNRVFQLRKNYYQQLTGDRKLNYQGNKMIEQKQKYHKLRLKQLNKSIKMYKTIVQGQKMRLLLNPKICRWVVLFCQKLKKKAKIKNNNTKSQSIHFVKKLQKQRIPQFVLALKKSAPAAKILKRQNHQNYRSQTKRYVQCQKSYYQPKFQEAISKLNKIKLVSPAASLMKQYTGGPLKQTKKVHVNLQKKEIKIDSKSCLKLIIKIQTIWRQHYYRKQYLKRILVIRKEQEAELSQKYDRLWRIYPLGRKINFKLIKNRLKNISLHRLSNPYIRQYLTPSVTLTCLSKNPYPQQILIQKYKKMNSSRLIQLLHLIQQDYYSTILQKTYVIMNKDINKIGQNGANMIWWAVKNGNLQLVTKLLRGGGDPNSKNIQCNTCLHQAIRNQHIDVVFLLLDYGANLNLKNNKKQTPLYYGTKKILKLLGLEDGHSCTLTAIGESSTSFDNNSLFFKPITQSIYPEHYF